MRIRSAVCSLIAVAAIVAGTFDARLAIAQDTEEDDPWSIAPGDPDSFTRAGAFAGLGFNWQVPGFQAPYRDQNYGNSWGFNARGGYRFYDWLAAEAIVEYADDFGPRRPGTTADNLSMLSTTVNGKFILPIDRFQPYLESGFGFLRVNDGDGFRREDRDIGFAGRIGAGIDLYVTRHISIFVDNSFTMATGDASDLYFYSLGGGARWNF